MASIINASTSGAGGVVTTADASGVLNIQTAGTTAISVDASQNVTLTNVLPQASGGTGTTIGYNGFKNRIINGAMQISQRNGTSTTTLTNGSDTWGGADRFKFYRDVGGTFTSAQSTTAPAGFTNSLLVTASTGASATAAQLNFFQQAIEGLNVADLGFGTADAQTVTVSFWVRSSVTGTYAVTLGNNAADRTYVSTFSINAADTFEYKTITVPGDTTGTWTTNSSSGLRVYFDLGSGSNYNGTANTWGAGLKLRTSGSVTWGATTGATFYLTGVQLEKGSTATSFDYRPYGTELALAQRYYYRITPDNSGAVNPAISYAGQVTSATGAASFNQFPVTMRAAPTSLDQTGTASNYGVRPASGTVTCTSVPVWSDITTQDVGCVTWTVASGLTTGQSVYVRILANNVYLGWSAEL